MKRNIIKSVLSVSLLALAAGCTDLDVSIKSQLTEFPDSDIAVEAKTSDVYYAFRGALGRSYHDAQVFSTDEAVGLSLAGDYYDNGRTVHFSLHSWNADNSSIGYYGDLTSGITKCNQAILDLGGEELAVAAPVRIMRAFYHFILMDSYGDTPILNHLLDEEEAITRSPRVEVAKFIESELLAVMDNLSTDINASTYGKPTAWMAKALLAKLYLNWAVYTCSDVATYTPAMNNEKLNNAIQMCDEVIKSGKFELGNDYISKFTPENGSQIKDFIYAMPYDRTDAKDSGMTWARFWTHRSANKDFYGVDLPNSVGGNYSILPEFVDLFCLEGDTRNEQILGLGTDGKLFLRDPNTYKTTSTPWVLEGKQVTLSKSITLDPNKDPATLDVGNDIHGGRAQGYKSIKFYMDLKTTKDQNRNQSNDVPIFRLADILLMKAEAILRGATATNGDTPASLINQLRDCAKAPHVDAGETVDLQYILDERGREMADECWRRNDLIRYGKFEDGFGFIKTVNPKSMIETFRRIFPIPTGVLNTNTNWKQNAGY